MNQSKIVSRKICSYCVMDDCNPHMVFDAAGQCNCCQDAIARMPHEWWPGPEGRTRMAAMVDMLKSNGQRKPYDAMIGLSGGIDSAYLAHVAVRELGLRVLAVHVDGGWNSAPAVRNIESIVRQLDIDLHTYVVEWAEMRDLQRAFLKASVLNQDIPQDHAFFSTLYRTAAHFGLKHFLSGVNFTTECIVPPQWGHPSMDGMHARAIHARFGTQPLENYCFMSLIEFLLKVHLSKQLTVHKPLNFMSYDKEVAREVLKREYKWQDYGGKHSESRFTKFYQEVYLPRKFGFDKRRLHLSSQIVSGYISREHALTELNEPIAPLAQVTRDIKFIAKKLGLSVAELESLIASKPIDHLAYPNQMQLHRGLSMLKSKVRYVSSLWRGHRVN